MKKPGPCHFLAPSRWCPLTIGDLECGGNAAALASLASYATDSLRGTSARARGSTKVKAPPLAAVGGALQRASAPSQNDALPRNREVVPGTVPDFHCL